LNNVTFRTGGDWDSTTLANNGQEVLANALNVKLTAGRDEGGNPAKGGIQLGGEMTAAIVPQDASEQEIAIFPGRLQLDFPGHEVIVENTNPGFMFEVTRVWYNGADVSNEILDLEVEVNAETNVVRAFIVLFKTHFLGAPEVATYTIWS